MTPAPEAGSRALLPLEPLVGFLRERDLIGSGTVAVQPIGHGHSNLTYGLTDGSTEVVVRRPPAPPLPPSAHDVLREARVLRAVANAIPVPRVLAVCEDETVIGAPFYVMGRVEGEVIVDTVPGGLRGREYPLAAALIDTLADLHGLDWRERGLAGFGRPTGYLERQLQRLGSVWAHNKTREVPEVERVGAWLRATMPRSGDAAIVHGDYRLGNVMYAPFVPVHLVAVFDWEMATIGDPLADLGYLVAFWVQPGDPPLKIFELAGATRAGGFPTREEMVERYARRTGRAVDRVGWYEVLALWKLAIVMEGNYRRARAGAVDDPYLAGFADGVIELAQRAAELVR